MIVGAKNVKIIIIRKIKKVVVVEGHVSLQERGELSVKTNRRLAWDLKRPARKSQGTSIRGELGMLGMEVRGYYKENKFGFLHFKSPFRS